jgi:hypothetical protein
MQLIGDLAIIPRASFSSNPPPVKRDPNKLTSVEKQDLADYAEKHKKFIAATPYPKVFPAIPRTSDLQEPSDIAELRVLSGQPKEHQERTVYYIDFYDFKQIRFSVCCMCNRSALVRASLIQCNLVISTWTSGR